MPLPLEQPSLRQRRSRKYAAPSAKPDDVSIQDFIMVGEEPSRFYAIGSDERVYVYMSGTHSWFLV